MSDGDPDIGPHLLLIIEAHALGADHSATWSAPGLLSYCVSGRSGHRACRSLIRVIDLTATAS